MSLPTTRDGAPLRRAASGLLVLLLSVALAPPAAPAATPGPGAASTDDAAWLMNDLTAAEPAVSSDAARPGLQLCLAAAADFSPIWPGNEFRANDRKVTVLFRLDEGQHPKHLNASFFAVAVPGIATDKPFARTGLNAPGPFGAFTLNTGTGLPPGRYRVDVAEENKVWKSAVFTVVPAIPAVDVKHPADLIDLHQGRTWTYDLTQAVAAIAHITDLPAGITKGADGNFHGGVIARTVGTDGDGVHFQYQRRGGAVFLEEWWRLDYRGLTATKRKDEAGDEMKLDPPQVIWHLPLKSPALWTYTFKQPKVHQNFQQWGPLRFQDGKDGYLVVIDQNDGPTTVSVEREFLPGTGMVRQVYVTALRSRFLQSETMVLTGVK